MKTLYDELGVAATASQDEIKAAYRVAAQRSHPDKEGGDEEQFKRIGVAFSVLNNPGRRAEYDKTGSTKEGPSVELEASQMLVNLFNSYIDNPSRQSPITFMRDSISRADAVRKAQMDQADATSKRIAKIQAKLKAPGLLSEVLLRRLSACEDEKTALARGELVLIAMRKLIEGAEYEEDPADPKMEWKAAWRSK